MAEGGWGGVITGLVQTLGGSGGGGNSNSGGGMSGGLGINSSTNDTGWNVAESGIKNFGFSAGGLNFAPKQNQGYVMAVAAVAGVIAVALIMRGKR